MDDQDGNGELRHSGRHSGMLSLATLGQLGQLHPHPEPEHRIGSRWSIPDSDPDGREVARRLAKAWRAWSVEERERFLKAAETIAKTELAKHDWGKKTTRHRYGGLSRTAVKGARLALEIAKVFPPPWDNERAVVGHVVKQLGAFASAVLSETIPYSHGQVHKASFVVQQLKSEAASKRHRLHWELLRDLAWLVSKKRVKVDERTIRRYGKTPGRLRNPEAAIWKRNWKLMLTLARVAAPFNDAANQSALRHAVGAYLQPPPRRRSRRN